MKIITSVVTALGVAVVGLGSASAQVGRFDPGLQSTNTLPITTVQADAGGFDKLPPGGGRAGMRAGGPRGQGPGPGMRAGGQDRFNGFGPRSGGQGRQFGRGQGRGFDGGRHHRGSGFGIGAGIAAGALLGGAIAAQSAPAYGYGYGYDAGPDIDDGGYVQAPPVYAGDGNAAYCAQRYKSYDPSSGTYLGYDGIRHPCP